MDMHQLRLASSLVATWQYARIYQAPVPKKYANLCSSLDCSFVHCALGRIIDWVELAREQSAFWHSYRWQNPATKEIESQEAYCERLNDIVVCGGVYSF